MEVIRSTMQLDEIDTQFSSITFEGEAFKAKAPVSDVVSKPRCFGAWLVEKVYWNSSYTASRMMGWGKASIDSSCVRMNRYYDQVATSINDLI